MAAQKSFNDTIRPTRWSDYIGQERMKQRLHISINAAITECRMLDPILLVGPPGSGKTTLASLIARESLLDVLTLTMPIKPARFFSLVEDFEGVVLLDELHAAPKAFQELLQMALEDKVIRTPDNYLIDVQDIVFVGATVPEMRTKVLPPLVQRFEIQPNWEPYSDEEIALIMASMAERAGFCLDLDICIDLAKACGSTPRLARRLVKAARDLNAVELEVSAASVLDHVGVDANGLGPDHLAYMQTVHSQHNRIGLRNLANLMCMTTHEIEDLERVLAQQGLLHLSLNGRRLTETGKARINAGKRDRLSA